MLAKIDEEGRIILPAPLLDKYGLRAAGKVRITEVGNALMIVPVTDEDKLEIEAELQGHLHSRHKGDTGQLRSSHSV
jgi:bifunctional DNA-binding transcriptional regulator/antitoxin component of YhaV-PrlF toxin-antitoxin module